MRNISVWLLVLSILFIIGVIFMAVYLPSNNVQLQGPSHPTMIPFPTEMPTEMPTFSPTPSPTN